MLRSKITHVDYSREWDDSVCGVKLYSLLPQSYKWKHQAEVNEAGNHRDQWKASRFFCSILVVYPTE